MARTKIEEDLALEDGTVLAHSLPIDRESSRIEFETATFGMG